MGNKLHGKSKEELIEIITSLENENQNLKAPPQTNHKEENSDFSLFDNSPLGIAIIQQDGELLFLSEKFTKILGYTHCDVHECKEWKKIVEEDLLYRKKTTELFKSDDNLKIKNELPARQIKIHSKNNSTKEIRLKVYFDKNENYFAFIEDITELKKYEEAYLVSEQKLKSVLDYAPLILWAVNSNRIITFIEGNAHLKLNINRLQTLGKHINDGIAEYPEAITGIENAFSGKIENVITNAFDYTFETSFSPIHDSKGKVISLVCRTIDITERVNYEDQIQLMQFAVENISDSVIGINPEGEIKYVNKSLCDQLQYTKEELLSLTLFDIDPQIRKENWKARWQKFKKNDGRNMVTEHKRKDGTLCSVEIVANHFVFNDQELNFAVCRDISEQLEQENKLIESETFFKTVIENAAGAPYKLFFGEDGEEGTYEFVSERIFELTGLKLEEFSENKFHNLIQEYHPVDEDIPREFYSLRHKYRTGDIVRYRNDLKILTPENEEKWLNDTSIPVKDKVGKVIGSLGILQDITERKKNERFLYERELRYRTLFECSNDAILLMERDIIIDCNPRTLELFEAEICDVIGEAPHLYSPELQPDGANSVIKAFEKIDLVLEDKPQQFEWIHRTKTGRLFEAEVSLLKTVLNGKAHIYGIVRNIAARKQYERELKYKTKLEQLLSTISQRFVNVTSNNEFENALYNSLKMIGTSFETDRVDFVEYDEKTSKIQWKVSWDNTGTSIPNYPLDEISIDDFPIWKTNIEQHEAFIVNDLNDIKEIDSSFFSFLNEFKLGSLLSIPVVLDGTIKGLLSLSLIDRKETWNRGLVSFLFNVGAVFVQTMERLAMDMSIKQSEKRFRSFFENVAIGIFQITESGSFLMANPHMIKTLGFKNFYEVSKLNFFVDCCVDKEMAEYYKETLGNRDQILGVEAKIKKHDGSIITVKNNIRPVISSKNKVKFFEGVMEDISGIKETELALISAKDEAEKSNKLKSEFLAQISHEIRTPVNALLSFSGLIQDELKEKLPEDLASSFGIMKNAGKRIIRTIDLILNMSEIQTGTYEFIPRTFDLKNDILENLEIEYAQIAKDKKLNFNLIAEDVDYSLVADEYTVNQIFQNLVDNAIKYTKDGKVEIRSGLNEDQKLFVEIEDTGIGMAPEFIPYLFEPFTQEEQGYTRKFEGNGLGMALVQKYSEINNCLISVKSKKNVGTTFILTFNSNRIS